MNHEGVQNHTLSVERGTVARKKEQENNRATRLGKSQPLFASGAAAPRRLLER